MKPFSYFQPTEIRFGAGRASEAGDVRLTYAYYLKQANSLISELTENDIALGSNVNMKAHVARVEIGLGRGVTLAHSVFLTSILRSSDPAARFYVPLGAATPRQIRYQGMLIFRF